MAANSGLISAPELGLSFNEDSSVPKSMFGAADLMSILGMSGGGQQSIPTTGTTASSTTGSAGKTELVGAVQNEQKLNWYDESNLDEVKKTLGTQADGRPNTLTGSSLVSILNPISAPKKVGNKTDAYAYYVDENYTPVRVSKDDVSYIDDSNNSGYMGYRTKDGHNATYVEGTPDLFQTSNGTLLPVLDGAQFGDPGGEYYTDQYDNPVGNGKRDQAVVTYKVVDGKAIPVDGENKYNPSDWVDFGRDATMLLGTVLGAGAIGAAMAGGTAAGGASAGAVEGSIATSAPAYMGPGTAGAGAAGEGATGWAALSPVVQQGLVGAGKGAASSLLTGGNPLTGAVTGGLTGGITSGMDSGALKTLVSGLLSNGMKDVAGSGKAAGTGAATSSAPSTQNSQSAILALLAKLLTAAQTTKKQG